MEKITRGSDIATSGASIYNSNIEQHFDPPIFEEMKTDILKENSDKSISSDVSPYRVDQTVEDNKTGSCSTNDDNIAESICYSTSELVSPTVEEKEQKTVNVVPTEKMTSENVAAPLTV